MFVPRDEDVILLDEKLFQVPVRSVALTTLGIKVFLAEITPENAKFFLERKFKNRGIKLPSLRKLIRTITLDRWEINGETIIFDDEGHLLDGQHRLKAVIESWKPIWSLIVYGINQERFKTMGQNSKRSAGDILAIAGERNGRNLAAALRWVWRYEHNLMLNEHPDVADDELADTIEQYPGLVESLSYGFRLQGLVAPGLVTALHYLCGQVDSSLANHFYWSLGTGANLDTDNPILTLRELFINANKKRTRLPDIYKAAVTIIAWNLLRKNPQATVKKLSWRRGNVRRAEFPKIT